MACPGRATDERNTAPAGRPARGRAELSPPGDRTHTLGVRTTAENGLSFVLTVDGRPLGEWIGANDWAVPFWYVVDDLPTFPAYADSRTTDARLVCCCSCGECGCGHVHCRVVRDGGHVTFRDFDGDDTTADAGVTFRFAAANYDAVVAEVVALATAHPQHPVNRDG